jgi:hypothetical protein
MSILSLAQRVRFLGWHLEAGKSASYFDSFVEKFYSRAYVCFPAATKVVRPAIAGVSADRSADHNHLISDIFVGGALPFGVVKVGIDTYEDNVTYSTLNGGYTPNGRVTAVSMLHESMTTYRPLPSSATDNNERWDRRVPKVWRGIAVSTDGRQSTCEPSGQYHILPASCWERHGEAWLFPDAAWERSYDRAIGCQTQRNHAIHVPFRR